MNHPTNQNFPFVPQSPLVRLGRSFIAGIKAAPKRAASRITGFFRSAAAKVRDFFNRFAEGDATTRSDIIYLEKLPLFNKEGDPI